MSTPTRYEVVLGHEEHGRFLHCYTPRKSLHGILAAARANRDELIEFCGTQAWSRAGKSAEGLKTSSGWTLCFSGRTQRDAKSEGELPWYRDQDVCSPF